MPIIFYPQDDELESANTDERLEILLTSAERYKAAVLDTAVKYGGTSSTGAKAGAVPRDIPMTFNWEYLSGLLRQIRELPEGAPSDRLAKAAKLEKLVGIYEVLRGARMPKLEAVRLALMNELTQIRGNAS